MRQQRWFLRRITSSSLSPLKPAPSTAKRPLTIGAALNEGRWPPMGGGLRPELQTFADQGSRIGRWLARRQLRSRRGTGPRSHRPCVLRPDCGHLEAKRRALVPCWFTASPTLAYPGRALRLRVGEKPTEPVAARQRNPSVSPQCWQRRRAGAATGQLPRSTGSPSARSLVHWDDLDEVCAEVLLWHGRPLDRQRSR